MTIHSILVLISLVLFIWAVAVAATWVDFGDWNVLLPAGLAFFVASHLPFEDRRL